MSYGKESPQINILINLSSRLLCEALQGLLDGDPSFRSVVVHERDKHRDFVPHKILVDAAALERSFTDQWGEAKIVLVDTGLGEDEVIRLLFQHRLDGVISTDTDASLFRKALETIHAGQVWIDNGKIRALLHTSPPAGNAPVFESFSKREREIVLLVAEGFRNREIAAHLHMSEQTVKTHLGRIFRKADVTRRSQLVPLALKFRVPDTV